MAKLSTQSQTDGLRKKPGKLKRSQEGVCFWFKMQLETPKDFLMALLGLKTTFPCLSLHGLTACYQALKTPGLNIEGVIASDPLTLYGFPAQSSQHAPLLKNKVK